MLPLNILKVVKSFAFILIFSNIRAKITLLHPKKPAKLQQIFGKRMTYSWRKCLKLDYFACSVGFLEKKNHKIDFVFTRGSLASLGTHSSNYEISIYIIISSTPHGSLALLGSLSAPWLIYYNGPSLKTVVAYVVSVFACCGHAAHAKRDFFHESISFMEVVN